ncbi:hypothetical protein [Actinokineospora enzanensis]|uniref:hypothetical protein n=1 Tax=Actinokineospora enzanensis TaxID=155975 RepID=UPI0009FD7C00|nr:hypothetical protein [Actinokineospora enzanensis]
MARTADERAAVTEVIAAARALGEGNPVAHHVTDTVLTEIADGHVRARSQGLGVQADGGRVGVTYDDTVRGLEHGWRITHRVVRARRVPLRP